MEVFKRYNRFLEGDVRDAAVRLTYLTVAHKPKMVQTHNPMIRSEVGGSSSGRTSDFGSDYRGSNPRPPANFIKALRGTPSKR